MKKVTIIIPIYNVVEYLPKCLDSVCNQTYGNLQIVLVNDGSTDTSLSICKKYAASDARITIVDKENGGLVSARKAGLEVANGDYIAFVDGDDWISNDMHEKMVRIAEEKQCDVVESGFVVENFLDNSTWNNSYTYVLKEAEYDLTEEIRSKLLANWLSDEEGALLLSTIWTKLYDAQLIKEAYKSVPDEMNLGEDKISFLYMMKRVTKIAVSDWTFYHYRNRVGSLSHSKGVRNYIKVSKMLNYCYDYISSNFKVEEKVLNRWYYMKVVPEFNEMRRLKN